MLYDLKTNYAEIGETAINELAAYVKRNEIKSLVIGMSGGIDSTVTAMLARKAIDKLASEGVVCDLIGYSIPIETNAPEETERGRQAMRAFCTTSAVVDQTMTFRVLLETMFPFEFSTLKERDMEEKIRCGNIKARLRMIYLYNAARKHNGIVLSTDNFTELMLGFWTLHGDVGDFGAIQALWKTEVYGLAKYYWGIYAEEAKENLASAERCSVLGAAIDAVPTDGLGVTTSDMDQLGLPTYEEVDKVLVEFMNAGISDDIPYNPEWDENVVIQRLRRTEFKRDNPHNIDRWAFFK